MKVNIDMMRACASKSPCRVIKFSASDGYTYAHNGEYYADCTDCKRTVIEQPYPECKANHAEWGVFVHNHKLWHAEDLYIYCMTPEGVDYPFKRFWCRTCAVLIPIFEYRNVFMWDGRWVWHDPQGLIKEVGGIIC